MTECHWETGCFVPAGTFDNSPVIYRWVWGCCGAFVRAIGFVTQRNVTEDETVPRPCFDLGPTPTDG